MVNIADGFRQAYTMSNWSDVRRSWRIAGGGQPLMDVAR